MAKEARITFEGEGTDEVMVMAYPEINKSLDVPIGVYRDQYLDHGYRHGMKQKFGDLGALPKELSAKEKAQMSYDSACELKEHFDNGGDWKRSGGGGLTRDLLEAVCKIMPKYTADMLKKAAKHDPSQVKNWRADPKVQLEMAEIAKRRAKERIKAEGSDELEIILPDEE